MAIRDIADDLSDDIRNAESVAWSLEQMFKRAGLPHNAKLGIALTLLGARICIKNGINATTTIQPALAGMKVPRGQQEM